MGGTSEAAVEKLRQFLVDAKGSVLRAWVEVIDANNNQTTSEFEFSYGMERLGYDSGNLFLLFESIKCFDDGVRDLTLDMIDADLSKEWYTFRRFAVGAFSSVDDMLQSCFGRAERKSTLADEGSSEFPASPTLRKEIHQLTREEFCRGIAKSGWSGTGEQLEKIFDALCDLEDHCLRASGLRWFGIEFERFRRRQDAKERITTLQGKPQPEVAVISGRERQRSFADFKAFLKKKFGNFVRAWRNLAEHDQMMISRAQFQKIVAGLGFKGATDLWKELNKDNSDFATLDELDLHNAEALAHFKGWVDQTFGGAQAAFKMLDLNGNQRVDRQEFVEAMRRLRFPRNSKHVFQLLDKQGDRKLEQSDLVFLDKWKPQEYLLASANVQAMAEIKELVLHHGGSYLKGWRLLFDGNNDNHCSWTEFCKAMKTLGYTGDSAGAWKAFDEDLTGYITLKELDEKAAKVLVEFRDWASEEFGSVANMYRIFDSNNSHSLSWKEFRKACHLYGYWGNARELFTALDIDGEGLVSLSEIKFLDDWVVHAMTQEELIQKEKEIQRRSVTSKKTDKRSPNSTRRHEDSIASKASPTRPTTSPGEQHFNLVLETSRHAAVVRRKRALVQRAEMPALGVVQERERLRSPRSPLNGYNQRVQHRLWLSPAGWGLIDYGESEWSSSARPSPRLPKSPRRPLSEMHARSPRSLDGLRAKPW
eukprot:TRINITY_DN31148_c0_g1_i1.p1 TRINITY_DN31148_c0_g1~~TRINITY_DN31148_c0_g1_i1.p1  ORF type:complete len:705 (+),score=124.97 TRINITY_DN31148_c0_g1_i1:42-2156(+)